MGDLEALEHDAREAQKDGPKSFVFLRDECPIEPCPLPADGSECPKCRLRRGPYEETVRMMELAQEIRAGVPLERDQLGITELELLAAIRKREDDQRMAAAMVGRSLGG